MSNDALLFAGGWVFDGRNAPVTGLGVLVESGSIRRVAKLAEFDGFAGQRFDTTGGTLMPGLIDAHVHLHACSTNDLVSAWRNASAADVSLKILENAQAALLGGVTAIRDLGGQNYLEFDVRDAIAAGRHPGPTIRLVGKLICITGGHGHFIGIEADGKDAIAKAVRQNVKAGADCIKIIVTGGVLTPGVDPLASHLTREEIETAVATAHALDRRIACHAQGAEGVRTAVAAGIDSVEHGFQLTDDVIDMMISAGTYYVPTLAAVANMARICDQLPDYVQAKIKKFSAMHNDSFRRYAKAGGKLAMGTDAGTPMNFHGENAQELTLMTNLGLANLDALRAATLNAAELLGIPDVGQVREGFKADLLVVRGNPLEDIGAVANPSRHLAVFKNGREVRQVLAAMAAMRDRPTFGSGPFELPGCYRSALDAQTHGAK